MSQFETQVREDLQTMQNGLRFARQEGRDAQAHAYDAMVQGYLMALRRCVSGKVYETVTEGLVD